MIKGTFTANFERKLSKLALTEIDGLSYSALFSALRKKDVKVNGARTNKDITLKVGDLVEIFFNPTEKEKFAVIFQDENVLVINKKKGFSSENIFETVKKKFEAAKFIHRLDTNTDGIMIFALNNMAEEELLKGFKTHTFSKVYLAEVVGKPPKKQDVIRAYLLKDKDTSSVRIYDREVKGAKPIKTGYKLVKEYAETCLLEVTLFTGKTHQIRAHLAHIGNPIVGDGKYGDFSYNQKIKENTQRLTAIRLSLEFDDNSPLNYLSGRTFEI